MPTLCSITARGNHGQAGGRHRPLLCGAIAILVYSCACHGAIAQGITLRYAQAFSALRSIFALPLLVAEREGYFIREGLAFSMIAVPGGGEIGRASCRERVWVWGGGVVL